MQDGRMSSLFRTGPCLYQASPRNAEAKPGDGASPAQRGETRRFQVSLAASPESSPAPGDRSRGKTTRRGLQHPGSSRRDRQNWAAPGDPAARRAGPGREGAAAAGGGGERAGPMPAAVPASLSPASFRWHLSSRNEPPGAARPLAALPGPRPRTTGAPPRSCRRRSGPCALRLPPARPLPPSIPCPSPPSSLSLLQPVNPI